MSRATGIIHKDGAVLGYFIYNGSIDCVWNGKIFNDPLTAWGDYESDCKKFNDAPDTYRCTCGTAPVDVTLRADYGGGIEWSGSVCLTCKAIVGGRNPYPDEDDQYGLCRPREEGAKK